MINSLRNLGIKLRDAVLVSTESEAYDRDERELLKGILVGDTLGFSDELYDKYSSSGFIHIASVSGMHTSYLLLAISFLLGLIRLPKRGVCLAAIPILILFSAVALFEPSVCRAVIMMIVMLLASIIKRNNDSITALSVAALVLSIENPYCLYNYSFLLSFGATLGVLIFYQPFKNTLNFTVVSMAEGGKRSFARRMIYKLKVFSLDSICLSLGAAIGLGYFMIRFFGRFQWGSIIGNIFIFPLTAISFIGGYVNCFIYAIHKPLSQLMAKLIINPSLFLTNKLADIFSADLFSIRIPYFSETFFVLYIFGCTLIYYILTAEKEKKS